MVAKRSEKEVKKIILCQQKEYTRYFCAKSVNLEKIWRSGEIAQKSDNKCFTRCNISSFLRKQQQHHFQKKTSKKQQQHQLHQKTGTLKLFIKSEKWRQHKTSALTEFATTSATTLRHYITSLTRTL